MTGDTSTLAPAQIVALGDTPDVLDEIWLPGRAAAIWQRRPQERLLAWIDALAPEKLPEMRLALPPNRVESYLERLCAARGGAGNPCGKMLASDAGFLATVFARVLKADRVTVRLDILRDDACRRFHLDNVPARLLCTYRGPGTEYGCAREGEDPDTIHRLQTGAVGLFRGRLWPGPEPSGIVHRSPPIAGRGETRLLLVIDPATDSD